MLWKSIAASALALTMVGALRAADPFSDVPRTHWAYKAIERAVEAGVLEGYDGKFHGEKLINRYQMAVIVKRILDGVGKAGGPAKAGMSGDDVKNLESMMIEFADELALLNVKVSTLEDSMVELRGEVDRMKVGSGMGTMTGGGLTNAFTGFLAASLVATDDSISGIPPAGGFGVGGPRTRYTATTADQLFFTLPQASIALDKEVDDGIALHIQYDYTTDVAGSAGTGVAGGGVGLNEAYLMVDEIFGDVGAKIGGFALPLQSWEVNGPFRTSSMSITPSVKNTTFEALRVVGFEMTKTQDVDAADIRWHVGVFSGGDIASPLGLLPPGPAPGLPIPVGGVGSVGFLADGAGLGGLAGSATFDDSFGFYLDLESGNDPSRDWGWRLGFFDNGGDTGITAPAAGIAPPGLAPSIEIDGWQIGFWWKNDTVKLMMEWTDLDIEGPQAIVPFPLVNNTNEADAWYFLVNWKLNDDNNITLRYDDWENEANGGGPPAAGAITGTEGDAITFAWNHQISDTSAFQFEWLAPDEDNVVAFGAGVGASDVDDDLVQLRYKVWF